MNRQWLMLCYLYVYVQMKNWLLETPNTGLDLMSNKILKVRNLCVLRRISNLEHLAKLYLNLGN